MKSKTFSIYLIKDGFTPYNALKDKHPLGSPVKATNLPDGSTMFLLDAKPFSPWWKDYWGVKEKIEQVQKGAIVFIPSNDRFFALTFGYTYHYLKENAYEYDFGLIITLNALDPNELKSTDILNPENSRRQRTQSPFGSDITFFNFDKDSSIIRNLTGRVKKEFKELFSNSTGASNLTVSIKKVPEEIPDFLSQLFNLYKKDTYKKSFPDIHNIVPLRDPTKIVELDNLLIKAFIEKNTNLFLSIPEITNPDMVLNMFFSGAGQKNVKIYQDIYLIHYQEYLDNNLNKDLTIDEIKKHSMNLCDDDGQKKKSYSVYKSLLFDCKINKENYHLCEGNWYQIENSYINKLNNYLDTFFYDDKLLPKYEHQTEEKYNISVSESNTNFICLDRENISPKGETAIEPCDLLSYNEKEGTAIFYHIKISTRSSLLSHLFNQGLSSVEILRAEEEARKKLISLINQKGKYNNHIKAINSDMIKVVYGIITHKKNEEKSHNLPLFSRISLRRCLYTLKMMKINANVCFIEDASIKKPSKPKVKKKKNKGGGKSV